MRPYLRHTFMVILIALAGMTVHDLSLGGISLTVALAQVFNSGFFGQIGAQVSSFLELNDGPGGPYSNHRRQLIRAHATNDALEWLEPPFKDPVALATTANITLSGEQTIDGTLTSTSRVLVWQQSTGTENGLYTTAAGAWTRTLDADQAAEFAGNWSVYVQGGALHGGKTFRLTNTGAVTLGSTAIGFAADSKDEKTANKNAASGYAGLSSATKLTYTQLGDEATHAALASSSQITPTATTMVLTSTGGAVELTTGNPQITGCTTAAAKGQLLILKGGSSTDTVQIDQGRGVKLCGQAGSAVVGSTRRALILECDGGSNWVEVGCPSLQSAAHVGRDIAADSSNPLTVSQPTDATNRLELETTSGVPRITGKVGGTAASSTTVELGSGGSLLVKNAGGSTIFSVANDTGIASGTLQQLTDHLNDTSAAHAASAIGFTPTGTIAASDVQAAIAEVASEAGTAAFKGVRVYRNSNQTFTSGDDATALSFTTTTDNTDSMWSAGAPTHITITTAGRYTGVCRFRFEANGGGSQRKGRLVLNGSIAIAEGNNLPISDDTTYVVVPLGFYTFAANDYLELLPYQNSGGNLAVQYNGSEPGLSPVCEIHRVGS